MRPFGITDFDDIENAKAQYAAITEELKAEIQELKSEENHLKMQLKIKTAESEIEKEKLLTQKLSLEKSIKQKNRVKSVK